MKKILIKTPEIAKVAGMTVERLRQLARDGHFPKPIRGVWDLRAVAQGLVAYLQARLKERRDSPEFIKAREEKAQHEAMLASLAVAEKQNAVLKKEAVLRVWFEHVVAARQIIQNSSLTQAEKRKTLEALAVSAEEYMKE